MTIGTLNIDGRRFRVIPEEEYQTLRAAQRLQQRQTAQDKSDLAEALRRLKDPKRKTISLTQLKAELGL